jgi:hypothetical protein
MPANATNILSDEVQHWVNTNMVVYSSVRTVLQHRQHLVNWELSMKLEQSDATVMLWHCWKLASTASGSHTLLVGLFVPVLQTP